jgi:hypothetical protein
MRRRHGKYALGGGTIGDDGLNPMDGVANLADVMLVLAVGIMLALVINWNIDVTPRDPGAAPPAVGAEIEAEGFGDGEGTPLDIDAQYEKAGVVYRDPETGKLYLVEE